MTAAFPDPDWRTRHCAEPAAEVISAALRRDVWCQLGGCPRSWREAAALYRRLGVTNLKDAVSAVLGEPIDRDNARHNDIALVDGALGVIHGTWAVRCVDRWQPIWRATAVWRVE